MDEVPCINFKKNKVGHTRNSMPDFIYLREIINILRR